MGFEVLGSRECSSLSSLMKIVMNVSACTEAVDCYRMREGYKTRA